MLKKIYTIYDKVADLHHSPFYSINDKVAIRTLQSMAQSNQSDLFRNSEDYYLFYHGSFNDETGSFSLVKAKLKINWEFKK